MICYYFPPLGGTGSLRALKFATYLPKFGWEPVVVAPRRGASYQDPSLSIGQTSVYRTGNLQLGRMTKGILGERASRAALKTSVAGRVRNLLRRWLYRPDGQVGWYPFAVNAGRRAAHEYRFDAIFSTSFPITSHLVARRLHRDTGIPWVAEFRDLWTQWGSASPRRQRLDQAMERSILTEAAEVVTVSSAFADGLRLQGAQRVSVVTNGFDPDDFPEPAMYEGVVVTYLGTYYPGHQDLGTALRALGSLAGEGMLPGLRVRFVGELESRLAQTIADSGIKDLVQCTGFVSHKEALRYICESALLLHAGPVSVDTEKVRGIIPGKTFEYLGSRRPILFIGNPTSDVAQLLRPFANVRIVAPGDVDGAKTSVLALLRQSEPPSSSSLQCFTSSYVTAQLAKTLDRVGV